MCFFFLIGKAHCYCREFIKYGELKKEKKTNHLWSQHSKIEVFYGFISSPLKV